VDEPTVVMTPEHVHYFNQVRKWLEKAPKNDDFWVGEVSIEWGHATEPIATFEANDEWWVIRVNNG
jgi:hypothetical protein